MANGDCWRWLDVVGIGLLAVLLAMGPSYAAELIMFEQAGCGWCRKWDEDVGPVYAKTPEGQRAPLRRVDIHGEMPKDLLFVAVGSYTPTFVLIDAGREIGRIRGYPGEAFFWGLLGELIDKLPAKPKP